MIEQLRKRHLNDSVGFCVILKASKTLNWNVGYPTRYYYNIFEQFFKFIPQYRFEKSVENLQRCKIGTVRLLI